MANGISKATSLPAISVGFAVSILVATWVAGGRFEAMERADAQATVEIEDLASRQSKYIGTTGLLTEQIDELTDRVIELEQEIAVLKVKFELNNGSR